MQRYTVKEVCGLAGVTVKTLYHYQKIGLLEPCEVTTAGYRLYSDKELARLQQILFYRELGFSLRDIKHALEHESERIHVLTKQQQLLLQRKAQLDQMLRTIADTIAAERKGKTMDKHEMFKGLNKQQWQETLKEQKEYLENRYGYEMDTDHIDAEKLNEAAAESERFMHELAEAYAGGLRFDDAHVQHLIGRHVGFLNERVAPTDAVSFKASARFFMEDDFHRSVLEGMHVGLSCYLYAAAVKYAETA